MANINLFYSLLVAREKIMYKLVVHYSTRELPTLYTTLQYEKIFTHEEME